MLLLLLASSCATAPVAGECPESAGVRCLSRKICDEDKRRACLRCTCESAWETDGTQEEKRQQGKVP